MNQTIVCAMVLLALCVPVMAAEKPKAGAKLFHETYRPQFHYTTKKGWINDPIGLVFYKGQYHLFNDHNVASCRFPDGKGSGEQSHWSHAVSPDLMHWKHMPVAVYPDDLGACWSGSGVVDWNNTAGFQAGQEKALVLIYTSAGKKTFGQSLAYSNDQGKTWKKHKHNPVLKQITGGNRDPKVFWHEPIKRWVMVLYLRGHDYALFTSPDLEQWDKLSDVKHPGAGECPDMFELPIRDVQGRLPAGKLEMRWIFWGGNGTYLVGSFDGKKFTTESGPHKTEWGRSCYAAQTWSDIPSEDGRRIIIGWMRGGKFPGMPFNQQSSIPRVITLRKSEEGLRLFLNPVREIEKVHGKGHTWLKFALKPSENPLAKLKGKLWDIDAVIEPGKAGQVGFDVRGQKIIYDVKGAKLTALGSSAALKMQGGKIKLRIVADVSSIEVFANRGRIVMSFSLPIDPKNTSLSMFAVGGEAKVDSLTVWECKSVWPQ